MASAYGLALGHFYSAPSTSYSNATPSEFVLLEPGFRGVDVGEDLDVFGITDLLASVLHFMAGAAARTALVVPIMADRLYAARACFRGSLAILGK